MHAILPSLLALAAFTFAQDLTDPTEAIKIIPACALGCFTQGIGASTCGPTDEHCQCTTGATDIAKVLIPCLCQAMAAGTCTRDDLLGAQTATFKICAAALKAKGETFDTPSPLEPNMCKALTGSTSTGGSTGESTGASTAPTTAGGYGGGNSTGGNNTTVSSGSSGSAGSPSSGTNSTASQGAANAVGAIDSFRLLVTCGFVGIAGVALMLI